VLALSEMAEARSKEDCPADERRGFMSIYLL